MKKEIHATNCSLMGLAYFIARPYLWIGPLFAALVTLLILINVFIFTAYFSWPNTDINWLFYTWGIFKAFGYASIAILVLWISLFPIILNIAFEKMSASILHEQKKEVKVQKMGKATISSIQVIFKTFHWRLCWLIISIISLFFFSPLTIFIVQIGLGHIAIIDGCDLSLTVQGIKSKTRIKYIKKYQGSILIAGMIGGFFSIILTTTIIGWIFWLPGIYAGTVLWSMNWPITESSDS